MDTPAEPDSHTPDVLTPDVLTQVPLAINAVAAAVHLLILLGIIAVLASQANAGVSSKSPLRWFTILPASILTLISYVLLLGVWATVVGNNHAALSDTIVRIIFAAGIVGDAGLVFFSLTLLLFLCTSFLRPAYNDLRRPAMMSRFFLSLISALLFVSSLVGAVALVLTRREDFPVKVPVAVPFGFRAAALLAWFAATIWAISCLAIGLSALRSRGYVGSLIPLTIGFCVCLVLYAIILVISHFITYFLFLVPMDMAAKGEPSGEFAPLEVISLSGITILFELLSYLLLLLVGSHDSVINGTLDEPDYAPYAPESTPPLHYRPPNEEHASDASDSALPLYQPTNDDTVPSASEIQPRKDVEMQERRDIQPQESKDTEVQRDV